MTPIHLVILSVSAGAGHVRAAAAICAHAETEGVKTTHIDVLTKTPGWFRWLYADVYGHLVNRAPLLWSWLYGRMNRTGDHGLLQRLRRASERRLSKRWLDEVAALTPDAILCTHFLPAEVLTQMSTRLRCPLFVQVTDFDLHAMWVQPGVDGYFTGSDEVAFQLRRAGVAAERITVSGLPVMPSFHPTALATLPARAVNAAPTVLLMGGGGGFGGLEQVARDLLAVHNEFHLVVVAGRNAAALAALQAIAPQWPGRLTPLGFTDQIATLMTAADIVITKPGGLTTAECLSVGVAMIVNAPIPGQEERNADYLLEQGVAMKAIDAATLAWRLQVLLENPAQRAAMAARARALGRPEAARCVLDTIVAAVAVKPVPLLKVPA